MLSRSSINIHILLKTLQVQPTLRLSGTVMQAFHSRWPWFVEEPVSQCTTAQKYCSRCSLCYFKFRWNGSAMSFSFHCAPWQMPMNAIMFVTITKLIKATLRDVPISDVVPEWKMKVDCSGWSYESSTVLVIRRPESYRNEWSWSRLQRTRVVLFTQVSWITQSQMYSYVRLRRHLENTAWCSFEHRALWEEAGCSESHTSWLLYPQRLNKQLTLHASSIHDYKDLGNYLDTISLFSHLALMRQ